jgi:mRNA-degrading endonuclease toxin of MazEF toxin-antitoxin module
MTTLARGRIYWARLPGDKRRPVLVVSPEARNALASDVLVVPVSSVLRQGPWHVHLGRGEGGLPRPSVLKCEQITTLRTDRIDPEPLGSPLAEQRMSAVERGVLRAIGGPVPRDPGAGD